MTLVSLKTRMFQCESGQDGEFAAAHTQSTSDYVWFMCILTFKVRCDRTVVWENVHGEIHAIQFNS